MKLAYIDLCGFRGYRKALRIDFADGFTVIDGRNGVGKSTICDAVEFALTGTIDKYQGAKADGETVEDYIWWSGEGPAPEQHYVEVGFRDGEKVLPVRRERLPDFDERGLSEVVDRLCDATMRPMAPLSQLCSASIIRDEHIAALSLDLTETQRYALLCQAIGATDAEHWVERGKSLAAQAKRRREAAEAEVSTTAREVAMAAKRIDELRVAVAEEAVVAAAVVRLQAFAGSTAAVDSISEATRLALAERTRRFEEITDIQRNWSNAEVHLMGLPSLRASVEAANQAVVEAEANLASLAAVAGPKDSSEAIAQRARDLTALVELGRRLGLDGGQHCPLCASGQGPAAYERGMAIAEDHAKQLDAHAVAQAQREHARRAAEAKVEAARSAADQRRLELERAVRGAAEFEHQLVRAGLDLGDGLAGILNDLDELSTELGQAREDLRIVETLKTNSALERETGAEQAAKKAHAKAEERLGVTRRAEQRAQALYDAARRAAGEALSQRLDRVLPLMSELYRRLRPHPLWGDIEYKIRGDVRRFLKLQVGDGLNPQFIFSSGQRRATGLAFLLAVNLSLAWSRWKTILLDDPVQHIDDFRSVHLAEVMAQLVKAGRQIICVVEDPALANLLCRRLPIVSFGDGKRVTLGPDGDGALSKLDERRLPPLLAGALVYGSSRVAG